MVIDQNNSFVNSFSKGMNTDTALDLVSNQLYVFGKNIRITTNGLIGNLTDSNFTEGIVAPVPESLYLNTVTESADRQLPFVPVYRPNPIINRIQQGSSDYQILASASIEDIGAIVVKSLKDDDDLNKWSVIRITHSIDDSGKDKLSMKSLFYSNVATDKDRFSVVINKETSDVINLYIADGEHDIMQINLLDDTPYYNYATIDWLQSGHRFPTNRVKIIERVSGQLKASQVQYTYRLYKKHGVVSKLAPLTQRIQVFDTNRNKEKGNAYDTETSVGFRLQIDYDKEVFLTFDHILVYRLLQVKANTNADIHLIYDGKIEVNDRNEGSNISFIDTGTGDLQQLSIEEYTALNSQDIVPLVIELNQNYLFAGNIIDRSVVNLEADSELFETPQYNVIGNKFDDRLSPTPEDGYCFLKSSNTSGYKPLGGGDEKSIVKYRLITAPVSIHPNSMKGDSEIIAKDLPGEGLLLNANVYYVNMDESGNVSYESTGKTVYNYFEDKDVCFNKLTYQDNFTSSMLRSLRRDEIYRYGIVLYDKYGNRSDAIHIADVRIPKEIPTTRPIEQLAGNQGEVVSTSYQYRDVKQSMITYPFEYKKNMYSDTAIILLEGVKDSYIQGDDVSLIDPVTTFDIKSGERVILNSPLFGKDEDNSIFKTYGGTYLNNQLWTNGKARDLFYIYCAIRVVDKDGNVVFSGSITEVDALGNFKGIPQRSFTADKDYDGCRIECISIVIDPIRNLYDPNSRSEEDCALQIQTDVFVRIGTPKEETQYITNDGTYGLFAQPIGVEFDVDLSGYPDITGYQIVRCEKSFNYTKNLMQCVLAKPVRQLVSKKDDNRKSTYYPTGFLTSQDISYLDSSTNRWPSDYYLGKKDTYNILASSDKNTTIFLMFSPDVLYQREDAMSTLELSSINLHIISLLYDNVPELYAAESNRTDTRSSSHPIMESDSSSVYIYREYMPPSMANTTSNTIFRRVIPNKATDKINDFVTAFYYLNNKINVPNRDFQIENVIDTKTPTWESGFSNIDVSSGLVTSGVKAYKSYETSIRGASYNNWVSSGMYDLNIGRSDKKTPFTEDYFRAFWYSDEPNRQNESTGWIGPGGISFIIKVQDNTVLTSFGSNNIPLGTLLCSIQKPYKVYSGITDSEKQYDIYYGFGNYQNAGLSNTVFDGDVYVMPYEITTMYKAYDFNSTLDTLPSLLIINYVPMESKYNFFLDYGQNYFNTRSANVQPEPSKITGVYIQDRPQHQYNQVFSDNSLSNDVFNARSLDSTETVYPQRIVYSQLKQNGEFIDNWTIFKPADFIDVDSRYGQVTNLLTVKDILYFWQPNAFGKLSVNERSLISDQNSNTIQLGQGGVLLRSDYISTLYGMREQDYSAIAVLSQIYWVDILRKAIVTSEGLLAINYSEAVNVQNLVNENIIEYPRPLIDYDIQNQELVCNCLSIGQLVFSTKLNVATSVYSREYGGTIYFNGMLVEIESGLKFKRSNFIKQDINTIQFMSPAQVDFVVNSTPSITKVFDNLSIVSSLRFCNNDAANFFEEKLFEFTTSLNTVSSIEDYTQSDIYTRPATDREGNLLYVIPRYLGSDGYSYRLRGKWMKVSMSDISPRYDNCISHVVTKFRQSYS